MAKKRASAHDQQHRQRYEEDEIASRVTKRPFARPINAVRHNAIRSEISIGRPAGLGSGASRPGRRQRPRRPKGRIRPAVSSSVMARSDDAQLRKKREEIRQIERMKETVVRYREEHHRHEKNKEQAASGFSNIRRRLWARAFSFRYRGDGRDETRPGIRCDLAHLYCSRIGPTVSLS